MRRSEDGVCVTVTGDELHRINVELYQNKLSLIAQIHSHPTEAYHSTTDDTFPIATTVGCLSLVVPDFAIRPFALRDCAVCRLQPTGRWMQLTQREVESLIFIE
ncbi:MAG: Mov34/MPN/PAD-1 family protein [Blastocatellia bacterium]|nr:Mov34/MPN/PAD-1 family protein [Blastocatellia bacterium]